MLMINGVGLMSLLGGSRVITCLEDFSFSNTLAIVVFDSLVIKLNNTAENGLDTETV